MDEKTTRQLLEIAQLTAAFHHKSWTYLGDQKFSLANGVSSLGLKAPLRMIMSI